MRYCKKCNAILTKNNLIKNGDHICKNCKLGTSLVTYSTSYINAVDFLESERLNNNTPQIGIKKTCIICDKKHLAKGYCRKHYDNIYRKQYMKEYMRQYRERNKNDRNT